MRTVYSYTHCHILIYMCIRQVTRDEDTGSESTIISLGAGIRKRVTLNTCALQQKQQVCDIQSLTTMLYAYLRICIPSYDVYILYAYIHQVNLPYKLYTL